MLVVNEMLGMFHLTCTICMYFAEFTNENVTFDCDVLKFCIIFAYVYAFYTCCFIRNISFYIYFLNNGTFVPNCHTSYLLRIKVTYLRYDVSNHCICGYLYQSI